ncbi:MAG: hypothetical protein NTZ93_05085 [Candidatus Beckwithbacteria bacterium]|nr:hypothetical protein [Candidatus Beckwithbacteria bacterium]
MVLVAPEAVDYSLYSSVDLLKMGIVTERQERIPVDLIVQENALIDFQHAQNLAESMMGPRKQISPITVRARLANSLAVYDIIDGFHRREGVSIIEQLTNELQIMNTITLYGCGDEELFDLRVLAASSVKSIKFARMAEWMKRSFFSTQWENARIHELVEQEKITLSQVFNLAQFDSSGTHLKLNLSQPEVIELKTWANKKSIQWDRPLSTLMFEMRTVELAAPDLVQRVRTGGGGKGGKGVLTKARLEAIVTHLHGDWETQRTLADLAISRNILADDLDFLAWSYAQAKEAMDQPTMTKILTAPELLLNPLLIVAETDNKAGTEQTIFFPQSWPKKHRLQRLRRQTQDSGMAEKADKVSESTILTKHNVPKIIENLMETILADKGEDLTILNIPHGELNLNLKSGVLKLGGQIVELSDRETELMTVFSLLEGMVISDKLLSMISLTKSRVNTREAVLSLKEKLALLSEEAAQELRISRKDEYSWLKE